uniref:SRP54-type proteins GTP-binding domain-containing protein n=1 Tax=Tetradesmus obliquus TaxID=3088 RepID=A0A383VUX2_TETOB
MQAGNVCHSRRCAPVVAPHDSAASSSRSRLQPVRAQQAEASPGLLAKLGRVIKEKAAGDYERFFKGTSKTRERLGLVEELLTFWSLEDYEDTLEELEEALITADFGPKTALTIVDGLREELKAGSIKTADDMRSALKRQIISLLEPASNSSSSSSSSGKTSELQLQGEPAVLLIVGVNGAGKTTTIGKLAHRLSKEGARVLLAPGDTFRAAAAEQLAEWARRSGAKMGTFKEGGRPGGVLAAACNDAKQQKDVDVVICDTAGRLHTAYALMEELANCRKSIANVLPKQPCETLLVLDGTTGLNMLNQAREFNDTVPLSGLILTKLDGTARGGAVVSVVDQLKLPVKFIGVGETPEDLQPFDAVNFAEALFPAAKQQ